MVGKPGYLGSESCFSRETPCFSYGLKTSCSLIVFWKEGKAITVLEHLPCEFVSLSNPHSSLLFYYFLHFKDEFEEV